MMPPVSCNESDMSKKWLRKKIQPMDAARYFTLGGVLPCDGYYTLQEEEPENPEHKRMWRFCKTLKQLPMELQMTIALRAVGLFGENIPSKHVEQSVREIAVLEWRRTQQGNPERSQ
jgi:hypothetical protein